MHKNQWKGSNGQYQCFYKGMSGVTVTNVTQFAVLFSGGVVRYLEIFVPCVTIMIYSIWFFTPSLTFNKNVQPFLLDLPIFPDKTICQMKT